ncbi:MAG TPA: Asp23/Gls24 family envelope stress response protein [Coriobacteriia bacterium]
MPAELSLEGLDIAPGVVETMVQLAAGQVEGVASVETSALGKLSRAPKATEVSLDEDGRFVVTLHITAIYGRPLRQLGAAIQDAVSDALESQTGHPASRVDVFIDTIQFPEQ